MAAGDAGGAAPVCTSRRGAWGLEPQPRQALGFLARESTVRHHHGDPFSPGLSQGSSRTQARAALGREFPISTLSIVERVPSPSLAHVSCVLSKIPYIEFSPVRLQAEASFDQPYPSRSPHELKPQVGMPPCDHRFDKVFVLVLPSCLCGGYYQRHQPRSSNPAMTFWLFRAFGDASFAGLPRQGPGVTQRNIGSS